MRRSWFLVRLMFLFLAVLSIVASACRSIDVEHIGKGKSSDSSPNNGSSEMGGGEQIILHIPLPYGVLALCTQGTNGSWSHGANCTRFDLDFDTSNVINEEIYAPVSGMAYVFHALMTGSSFGNHVNIDIGGGYYVVIGHLKETFICDGCEVSVGQLIAFEGCTGSCTGDHIHIGLHKGNPLLPAEQGTSVLSDFQYLDENGDAIVLSADEFVCGIGGGDDQMGDLYASVLPVPLDHPDGTLVMSAHNPKVYLLENGIRHWILNEQVFWSFGFNFADVTLVSDEELGCYPEAEALLTPSLVDAVTDPSGIKWLVVGTISDPGRYRIRVELFGWQGVLASWGLPYAAQNPPPIVDFNHMYFQHWEEVDGHAQFRTGSLVRESSSSTVYVMAPNMAMPVFDWNTFLLLGFGERPVVWTEDGAVLYVQKQIGNCQTGQHCVSLEQVRVCGANQPVAPESPGVGGNMTYNGNGSNTGEGEGSAQDIPNEPAEPVAEESESEPSAREPQPRENEEPLPASEPEPTDSRSNEEPVTQDPEPDPVQEDPQEPIASEEPTPTEPSSGTHACPGDVLACLSDQNQDGKLETLLLADHLWVSSMLEGIPAFVYGNGGCFGGALTSSDLVFSQDGYYAVDFSQFAVDCQSQITLISTLSMDGKAITYDMSNWMWWQGGEFCKTSSSLCHLMNNGTPWEEWLLALSWNPTTGLSGSGNGFTSNMQL